VKLKLLFVVGTAIASSATAADRAVQSTHYQVSVSGEFRQYDLGSDIDGDEVGAALGASLVLPIGRYFGASAELEFEKSVSEDERYDQEYSESDTDIWTGIVGLFYRDPEFGRVSVGYGRSRLSYDATYRYFGSSYDVSDSFTSSAWLLSAESYVGPVTIGLDASREIGGDEDTDDDIGKVVRARWYVAPNVRLGLTALLDDEDDFYGADIEFQPAFLRDVCGFFLAYDHVGGESSYGSDSVRVGVNFYFNQRVDLLTRDRHYR
jgi:hypothetical protein